MDADDATLTYSLSGTDVDFFEIDTATGQLKTKAGVTYDHEDKPGYTVTVSVHDGKAADGRPDASIDDDITVTINITDENEPPNRPPAPTIETTGNSDSLRVTPNAPDNTGRPDIDEYDLQYRPKDSRETFTLESNIGGQGTLEQLLLNTEYEVQVRARNDEGTGDWSESATQRTGTATATIIATPTTINESGATNRSAITARLDGLLTQDLTLTVSATPEAPAEASDFTLSENVTLTIAAGQMESSGTVTVTAQDNQVDNDDRTVNVGATSETANLTINGAAITIQDDDTRGITATPDSNVTTEDGGTVTVGVKLNSQPTAAVTIGVTSSNTNEGTVSPETLTFTTGNWNTAQDVTVTGQDDSVDDGDTGYAITFTAASPDPLYEGQRASVELTNTDDDTRSVEITTTSTTDPPTLRVSEVAPGNTASYTVVLTSQPSDGNVTVTPVSSAPDNATVSAALIFTPQNWNTAQPVTITAVDDLIDNEADRTATITHEVAGADYGRHNVVAGSIEVTVTDNDEEGVTVSATELTVGETGDGSYTIVLNSQPTGTVTVTPAAGGDHPDAIAITPPELTFTTENWNNAQTVTVTGQRDHVDNEADRTASISHSAGGDYAGVTITGVEVTITDSDTAGVTLDQKHTSVTEGQQSGDNPVSYTVVLDSKPRAGHVVKINITVAGPADTDPSSLTFTRENWNVPQSIRVTAHDDGVVSEPRTAVVSHQIVDAESSPEYGTVAVDDVSFDIVEDDHAPVFGDGESTAREVPENSVPGVNVGAAVEATDGDSDTLTYTLGGTDSVFFGIHEGTGQITTQETSYDFETKPQYAITVTASDTHGNTDSIAVTIKLTDVNDAPVFTEGDTATRSLPENSGANVNVGAPVSATDQDRNPADTLTYTLGGTDAGSFEIDDGTGQLTTKSGVSYDLEAKASYSVTVTATDPDNAADTIAVTVNLTDANDAPTFDEGDPTTRSLPENSGANVNVGDPVAATDQDGDTLTYTLTGTDATSFEIDEGTGQLTTKQGASYDYETKASYTVTVGVSDGTAADSIAVTVDLTDANDAPVFTEGESATRSLAENSGANVNVGDPVAATDQDGDTLTYTLSGDDAVSFEINASTGQLTTKSGVSYDLETKASYAVTVTATDSDSAADSIAVTVNLTDANDAPVFSEGESATRSLPENSGANLNVGAAVAATDQDRNPADTLTYTLSGTDAGSFEIVASSGQLTTKSGVSYDLETKASYTVTVTATDPDSAADTIAVTVNLTDANDAPTFDDGDSTTRSVPENSGANVNVGAAVTATDQDNDTLTYTLGGTDAGSFDVDDGTGQLTTKSGVSYDLEAKASYSVTVTATDPDNAADTIAVTVNLTDANDAPTFTEGESATRSVPENSGANVNVGAPLAATDQDNDTLTYTLSGTDMASFDIDGETGQLTTKSGVSYDLEAKASYSVTVTATDPDNAADSIAVTVNLTDANDAPVFTEGESATRSLAENTAAGENVGLPLTATDQDRDEDGNPDTLTYTLGGTDAGSFEIVETSGQLQTKSGVSYDLETKASYAVTVTASDPDNAADAIAVTVNLTDVNDAPVFSDGDSTTRSLAENTAAGENVGLPLTATDQDRDEDGNPDTLTYTLGGTDAGSFEIVASSGQLTTKSGASYDLEAKASYSVTVGVSDGTAADSIAVTINLTDVNDAPTFTEGDSATRSLPENSGANVNVGLPLAATDQDGNPVDTLTYSLSGTDAGSFEIVESSGQLQTKSGVSYDLEVKASYSVTVGVSDGTAADSISVTVNLTDANDAPTFTEGESATRSLVENTAAGQNVGAAVSATDQDNDTLTYTLSGDDAGSFEIDGGTGQLTTKSGVSYDLETKASYSVTVTATDPDSAADTIAVTVNLTDANDAPVFSDGDSTTRSVPENSGANVNVGAPLAATDQDGNTLTYTLGGTDAGSFEIVASSGQLTTKSGVSYDLETKASYSVTVTATDPDSAADTIAVTINLTDVNDAPVFTEGESATRSLPENTAAGENVGLPLTATDQDRNPADTLTYTLGGTDAGSFDVDDGTGQLTTKSGVSYDLETKASYTVTVTATDPDNAADTIAVTVNLTDANDAPVFSDGDSTTRSVPENSGANVHVGAAVSATDQDGDTLTYTLGGADAGSFEIVASSGQLTTKSGVSYDLEAKASYSVTVGVEDPGGGSDSTTVTINLTDANDAPVFIEGENATRSVPENSGANVNVGAPVSATDQDRNPADTLTYSLSGTDAGSFDIDDGTGQLQTKSGVSYDLETKASYSVTVTATDPDNAADTIAVTVNLTDANDAPVFTEGESATRSVPENSGANVNVGAAVSATDQDNDTLTYTLSGTDAVSFEIVASSGQLTTKSGVSYDLETKASYTVTVGVSDGTAADSIAVTINLTDVNDAPTFSEGDSTTRSLAENTAAGENVGAAVSATDQDGDTLTYTLSGTDAGSFEIVASSGQLTTKSEVSYDLEAKASYTVTVGVSDGTAADSISVTANLTDANDAPTFTEGESATRSLVENTAAGQNVGAAVSATDQDNDTLTYTLTGTDATSFEIDGGTGQLRTKSGVSYDLEAKASYSVTVTATDPDSAADSISVTVNLTDVNDAPTFSDGDSTTRSVAENTAAGENVGAAVSATDQDGDTLTYTLTGTDAASFEIVETSGQLQTKSGVSYDLENKASYSVTVTATDPDSAADTIAVTVNLTDVNDAPTFSEGESATRSLAENTAAGENVGAAVAATDQDGNTLTYTLSGTDAGSFEIVASSGQLLTKSGVNYDLETKASYTVTVTATDPDNAADSIAVTINLTDVNDAPTFTAGDTATRSVPENSGSNVNVGLPLIATDQDGNTLTYTLSGTDASSFEIVETSGQLTTKSGVSYDLENKASYSVTVTATDPDNAADTIAVTVNLTDANDAPVFTEGDSATRSLAENSGAGVNVGAAVSATDQDNDTLTYTLSGDDAGSFDINASTGQLTTKQGTSYDYEAKASYSVTVTATDPDNAADTIAVTVNLTDANDAPVFTEGDSATCSVAENSGAGVNVGAAVTATDQDNDTLTYTLGGTDAGSFEIVESSGQLRTKSGVSYDYETKVSYTVNVMAADPEDNRDSITVTVNLTDANDPPVFSEGDRATRSIPENTAAARNIGAPVIATDQDGDTITYTLSGRDAASFQIDAGTGQLLTRFGVTYDVETRASYSVTVGVSDGTAADSIAVAIHLTDVNDCIPSGNIPANDNVPTVNSYPNASPDMREFPNLRVRGNLEFRLEFPNAGGGNGGRYYFNIRRADTGESLSNNSTALPGVSFDPYGRVLRGKLLTRGLTPDIDEQMSPAIHQLEYVVHDGDGNCSPEDSAVIPFTITASEKWSQVFITTKYPWVAEGEDAVFVLKGRYAFNVPTVTLEITTTGDQDVQTRRDTVTIPVTATKDASVEYAVPTTGLDAVTVALVPQDGYIVHVVSWLNSATVQVVEEVIRPVVTVSVDGGSPTPKVPSGGTIVLRGWHSIDPPYESGTGELTYYEWEQTKGPQVELGRTTHRNLSVTIPEGISHGELLDFTLTVKVSPEGSTDMDTGTGTVRIQVTPATGASGSGGPDPEPVTLPTANAGPDLSGAPGESVTIQGTDSTNPYGEWWQMQHQWTQLSGPSVTLSDPTRGDPTFTIPSGAADGTTLEFQLTVTDTEGESDSDTVTVTVVVPDPVLPTACAGPDLAGAPGDEVTLEGRCSINPHGKWYQMAHAWTQLSGPTVTLSDATVGNPSFTIPADAEVETTLAFELTVTDKEGVSDSDTMIVTVAGAEPENTPPTAAIDAAQVTTARTGETVALQGVGNDAETAAVSLTFAWSQAGGTPQVSIANAGAATASFTAPDVTEETALTFRLTVTDEEGLSADAEITVAISPPPTTPEISIERAGVSLVVREGRAAEFEIVASEATSVDLTLTLEIAVQGDFGVTPGRRTVMLEAGESELDLAFETDDDDAGEANGLLTVTVVEGAGYAVGSPASAELAVTDDDGGEPLTGVSLDGIPLEFAPDRTEYLVQVAHEVAQTAVRTADGAALQIAANGAGVEVGEVIPLEVGGNVIKIARSSAGAAGQWYTVTITRASPAAPDAEPSSNGWSIHLDPASGVRPAEGQTAVDVRVTVKCNGSALLSEAHCPFEPGSVTFQIQADGSEPGEATNRTDFGGPRKPFVVEHGPQNYVVRLNIRPGSGDAEYVPFVLMVNGVQAAEARFQITP